MLPLFILTWQWTWSVGHGKAVVVVLTLPDGKENTYHRFINLSVEWFSMSNKKYFDWWMSSLKVNKHILIKIITKKLISRIGIF